MAEKLKIIPLGGLNEIGKNMTVVVMAKGGGAGKLFGSVTNAEIAEALEKQEKIAIDKRKLL